MRDLAELQSGAEATLDRYTDPAGRYAYRTYDVTPLNSSGPLLPEDILISNLLSLQLKWQHVIPLFAAGDGPPQQLLAALNEALALRDADPFESYRTADDVVEVLEPVAAANRATNGVWGWTAVTVSKVLHRHAPHIVPIVDSRVRAFFRTSPGRQEQELRRRLWTGIQKNLDWLRPLAEGRSTPDGRPLSILRLVDILIWTPRHEAGT